MKQNDLTPPKLFKILTILESIRSTQWNMVRELVLKTNFKVINKAWALNYYKASDKLDLKKIETWSTYDRTCIDLKFYVKKDSLYCNAQIYDGRSMDGDRRELRFTAILELPEGFILQLKDSLDYQFNKYLDEQYEAYLLQQKTLWTQHLKDTLLRF